MLYNDHHADFLLVKDDEPMLLDYLATLVAKEYVVYNNPVASGEVTAEDMVRMVVRVRRHLQRRRTNAGKEHLLLSQAPERAGDQSAGVGCLAAGGALRAKAPRGTAESQGSLLHVKLVAMCTS